MIFRISSLVIATASYVVSAYPQTTPSNSLPSSLQNTIPQCARSCLSSSLTNTFPLSCSSSGDLGCLCSRYNKYGFTLGEAILGCLYTSCPRDNEQEDSFYNICSGQDEAVRPTHTPLPLSASLFQATATGSSSTPSSSSTPDPATQVQSTMLTPPRLTPISTSLPFGAPATTNSLPGPSAAAASVPNPAGPLSTAQIVGISVAGAAALVLAAGAIILMTCVQRRRGRRAMEQAKLDRLARQNEKHGHHQRDPSSGSASLRPLILPTRVLRDPRGGAGGVGVAPVPVQPRSYDPLPRRSTYGLAPVQTNLPRVQVNAQLPQTNWVNPQIPTDQIGLAISPESELDNSPASMRSTRTVSRLLPAKPSPLVPRPDSTLSGMTVFEEDNLRKSMGQILTTRPPLARLSAANAHVEFPTPPMFANKLSPIKDLSMAPLPLNHQSRVIRAVAPTAPTASTAPHVFTTPAVAETNKQPSLSLNIPVRHNRMPGAPNQGTGATQASQSVNPINKSPVKLFVLPEYSSPATEAPPASTSAKPTHGANPDVAAATRDSGNSSGSNSSDGYIPKYYHTSRLPFATSTLDKPRKSPKLVNIRRAPSAHTSVSISRTSTSKSTSGRDSMASVTTFESADMDEPTPPSDGEEKTLTPVPESPITGLRYPKVPRASNQAVPRSPRSPQKALSLDTRPSLLTKRRGQEAAHDLEKRLFVSPVGTSIRSSNYSRFSHGRTGSDGPAGPKIASSQVSVRSQHISADMAGPLMSPMWAPRITPTRRGQDLFLSVS